MFQCNPPSLVIKSFLNGGKLPLSKQPPLHPSHVSRWLFQALRRVYWMKRIVCWIWALKIRSACCWHGACPRLVKVSSDGVGGYEIGKVRYKSRGSWRCWQQAGGYTRDTCDVLMELWMYRRWTMRYNKYVSLVLRQQMKFLSSIWNCIETSRGFATQPC